MEHHHWYVGMAVALALSGIPGHSEAAPKSGTTIRIKATAGTAAVIETVAYRHCWRRNGQRRCRVVAYRPTYSNYYERDSNLLPYGTLIWWDQMVRENRASPGGRR
jgi:hypothetical protein